VVGVREFVVVVVVVIMEVVLDVMKVEVGFDVEDMRRLSAVIEPVFVVEIVLVVALRQGR